jgi:hypothetical protein
MQELSPGGLLGIESAQEARGSGTAGAAIRTDFAAGETPKTRDSKDLCWN